MSAQENKELVRRMFDEVFVKGKLELIDRYFSPDWVNTDPSVPPMRGYDGARQLVNMMRNGFSGFKIRIDDLLAEGDWVAARFHSIGTNTGPFLTMPATGKPVDIQALGLFHVVNGRITENKVIFDALSMMQQLGVMRAPQTATRR